MELEHLTKDDTLVYLSEDFPISDFLENRLSDKIPIYWETAELESKEIFELRTKRFEDLGYNPKLLHKKHVLIGGIGLLGSEIAFNLATIGVGKLTVIDKGYVDWYNLYRVIFIKSILYIH